MKSLLVIGMGRFGKHLARKLMELGNDVMIIDKDESIINTLSASFTDAFVGDCTNPAVIHSLGINNFDICFVTIGDNFQSSLEITSLLKEAGAKYIVSKATVDMQAKFLKQIGADEVVYPEHDMAIRLAIKHNANNVFDYIEIGLISFFLHDKIFGFFPDHIDSSFTASITTVFRILLHPQQFKQMLGRCRIAVFTGIPPFENGLIRIDVLSAIYQYPTIFHPSGDILMIGRFLRFHVGIRHHKYFQLFPGFRITGIFDMYDLCRDSPLYQRQGLSIEI